MIYLHETFKLHTAMPTVLEGFIKFVDEQMIPLYEECGAKLNAAWFCNAQTVFQVNQIVEFENHEAFLKFSCFIKEHADDESFEKTLNRITPQRTRQLYESAGSAFSTSFHNAIQESKKAPLKTYTIATLEVVHDQIAGLVQRNEGAIAAGMPFITSMISITGKQNQIMNIWKGDFNAVGYQDQKFYDGLGFTEEWWKWVRSVAPQEGLATVYMLPYSPLQ